MTTINEMIIKNVSLGMTRREAENYSCQEIIMSKISKSCFKDKTLIKGGIVMFNYTHNLRRTTSDLDFDFVRYDISEESIKLFIGELNKNDDDYFIRVESIKELHQDDYRGKRVWVLISDGKSELKFKLDIGVHTLSAIEQDNLVFSFSDDGESLTLKANPPEQIFAEKLYSLAKHGILSERYKDVFDMYYLIEHKNINKKIVEECLSLLTLIGRYDMHSKYDVYGNVITILSDSFYLERLKATKKKWLDIDIDVMVEKIIRFIN